MRLEPVTTIRSMNLNLNYTHSRTVGLYDGKNTYKELCRCSLCILTVSAWARYWAGVECFLNLGWTSLKELLL